MSCPWAKIGKPDTLNLTDIISEEVTRNLQAKKKNRDLKNVVFTSAEVLVDSNIPVGAVLESIFENTLKNNDGIAETAQTQFPKDNDQELKYTEKQFNEFSNVPVYCDNSSRTPPNNDFESDYEDENVHDIIDEETYDLRLSNKAFNSLKVQFNKKGRRRNKKQNQAITESGVDESTLDLLSKMINTNTFKIYGEEAVIFDAENTNPSLTMRIQEFEIKMFKSTLSRGDKYIKIDHHFKDRIGKLMTRKIMSLESTKEMETINRLRNAGVPCTAVLKLKHHVLVMSFIGKKYVPTPKSKNARKKDVDYNKAYDHVIWAMRRLFRMAKLIHADLSEDSILWYYKQSYFTDFSKCTETSHCDAFSLLYRNCITITNFFREKGVEGLLKPEYLLEFITCQVDPSTTQLLQMQKLAKLDLQVIKKWLNVN